MISNVFLQPEPKPHGVVVEGEASESEEEELDSNGNALPSTQQKCKKYSEHFVYSDLYEIISA